MRQLERNIKSGYYQRILAHKYPLNEVLSQQLFVYKYQALLPTEEELAAIIDLEIDK